MVYNFSAAKLLNAPASILRAVQRIHQQPSAIMSTMQR